MKISSKNRKWILHFHHLGVGHENFAAPWPSDKGGISAVQAFAIYESTGVVHTTNSPKAMGRLTSGKKIHGINVDMYARDRAGGMLPVWELKEMCNEVPGMFEEVEKLKVAYW